MLDRLHVRPAFNTQHRYVCSGDPSASRGVQVVAQVYGPNAEPQAALFAASGDLLAACKAALEEMRHTIAPRNSFTDAVDTLDAAIAKAEGHSDA